MVMPGDTVLSERDLRVLEKLGDFIPEKVFDAHAHLYDSKFTPVLATPGSTFAQCGPIADRECFMRLQGPLYLGAKQVRLNLISVPDPSMKDLRNGNRACSVEFLINHLNQNPEDVGEVFVLPDDTDSDIESMLTHPGIRGFKCYHSVAARNVTWQADIDEYLPESAWRVANERGMCITLHLVKDAALADHGNLETIKRKARKYPGAKLILAHAARGFAAWTALEGLKGLSGFPNIYYDVSAVCEPTAIFAVIKKAGARQVLWGSDFPVSMFRGKCISLADTFLWIYRPMLACFDDPNAALATLVGVENLNALAQACDMLDLTCKDIEDIFYNNAVRMFGLSG